MRHSRLGRYQETKLAKRTLLAFAGGIAILAFLFLFGVKILIGFSIFVDQIRGKAPSLQSSSQEVYVPPPTLDPLPEATNSATLVVTGYGKPGMNVTLYKNDVEEETVSVEGDGTFTFKNVRVKDGNYTFAAKQTDGKKHDSARSDPVVTLIKLKEPSLEITSPQADASIFGEEHGNLTVSGSTDPGNTVTVNGRITVVRTDGSFSYSFALQTGDNVISIVTTDDAGNQKTEERTVRFEK